VGDGGVGASQKIPNMGAEERQGEKGPQTSVSADVVVIAVYRSSFCHLTLLFALG